VTRSQISQNADPGNKSGFYEFHDKAVGFAANLLIEHVQAVIVFHVAQDFIPLLMQ